MITRIKFKLRRKWKMIKLEYRFHKRFLTSERIIRKHKVKRLISIITRRCENRGYGCSGGWAYIKHGNCAYVDELSNYYYCCKECHEEVDARYQEMWDDYYSSIY